MLLPAEGLFLETEATYPRLISLTETFLMLNPTLSPGTASASVVMSSARVAFCFGSLFLMAFCHEISSDFVPNSKKNGA